MGGALTDAVWIFAVVLALIVLAAVALASRRYLLERSGGTVDCALRWPDGAGAWRLGVLAYQHDSLRWYGALGVLLRPEYVFHRRALSVIAQRPAEPSEVVALGSDRIVVAVASQAASGRRRFPARRAGRAGHDRPGPDGVPGLAGGFPARFSPRRLLLRLVSLRSKPLLAAGRGGRGNRRALVGPPISTHPGTPRTPADRRPEGARLIPRRPPRPPRALAHI